MATRSATKLRRQGLPVPARPQRGKPALINTEDSAECYDCLINKVKFPRNYKRLRKFGKCPNEGCMNHGRKRR